MADVHWMTFCPHAKSLWIECVSENYTRSTTLSHTHCFHAKTNCQSNPLYYTIAFPSLFLSVLYNHNCLHLSLSLHHLQQCFTSQTPPPPGYIMPRFPVLSGKSRAWSRGGNLPVQERLPGGLKGRKTPPPPLQNGGSGS